MKLEQPAWLLADLPLTDYGEARELQLRLVEARAAGSLTRDVILLLEHPPVFTLGRRGGLEHLVVPAGFLREKGVPVVHAERGGHITYHGPGQLVAYGIVDLREKRLGVTEYVEGLEEVMIRTAGDWNVAAVRNPLNRGVWVEGKKLGSVGIAIRHGVSFHGLALNVDLSLEPFSWIHPCGLEGIAVTSLARESGRPVPLERVRRGLCRHVCDVFGVTLTGTDVEEWKESPFPGAAQGKGRP